MAYCWFLRYNKRSKRCMFFEPLANCSLDWLYRLCEGARCSGSSELLRIETGIHNQQQFLAQE